MTLTEEQKAYFAGIFDASGIMCLSVYKGDRLRPLIEFRRSDRALLDVLAQTFGGHVRPYKMRTYDSFYWRAFGANAQGIVRILRPYMQARGSEADRLLRWQPRPNGWQAQKAERARARSWTGLGVAA